MRIFVPNLGSTSFKYKTFDLPGGAVTAHGRMERVRDYREAILAAHRQHPDFDAVALKAVHGGPQYRGTYLVDAGVMSALEEFLPAAPVHNRIYLEAIRAFQEVLPDVPLVAAFETEFHATMPAAAQAYGVPHGWREAGVMRYGFHGASHQYVSEVLGRLIGAVRLVSCHLGGSSSLCAISGGRSIDTTMGFSPQSGIENATRHGELDPFAVLFMMERAGWDLAAVRGQLAAEAGLAGLAGIAGGDVRDLEAARTPEARLALDVLGLQVRKTIGAYAAAMGGLDAIAFTGGIGENSATLRRAICEPLGFLGVALDRAANEEGSGDRRISAPDAGVAVFVIAANEELVVARRAYHCLMSSRRRAGSGTAPCDSAAS
ncbi:MAG: acetate/propionate family kinase [Bryobacterales bacterium]|nr:acetate/propionate family kinase [Bryobacterales bacterium]